MITKKLFVFSCLLVLTSVSYPQSDSVNRFIDSAINLMQRHSMYAKNVDWEAVCDSVERLSASARNYTETLPALQFAFNSLGDKHGWLVINDKEYRNTSLQLKDNRIPQNIIDAMMKGARIYCGVVAGRYAYLSMPFFGKQDTTSMNNFAQRLQDSLCSVVTPKIKGVILDLRLNAGGNSFPMIMGVSNLYGKQPRRKDGTEYTGDWEIRNNEIRLSETFYVRLTRSCGNLSRLPVAVVVGPQTGSSGEFIAISFSTRHKTVLVGEETAGYTTGNQGYLLPGVNNAIVLAESVAVDRFGREYPNGIKPSIPVKGDDFFHREQDPKILAAIAWLNRQSAKK